MLDESLPHVQVTLPSVRLGYGEIVLVAALTLVPDELPIFCVLPDIDQVDDHLEEFVKNICLKLTNGKVRNINVVPKVELSDNDHLYERRVCRIVAHNDAIVAVKEIETLANFLQMIS